MLAMLREHFLHTVIDTSTQLGETTLVALDAATKIVVVVNPTMLSIKNAKLTLHILSVLNVASDRTCLVVVHNAERQSIQLEDIERTLQCPAAVVIPFDGDTVEGALREGKSFLDTKPEARISRSVRVLVGQVVGAAVEAGEPHPRQRASPVLRAASHS
jgi:Flp pilus assembly CpaE family ATPase